MRGVAKQFAVVFFAGFIALTAALAYSSMTAGSLLDDQPFFVALRAFGLGWMATGMVLWIVLRRDEGGKPEINPLLGMMIGVGCASLLAALFFPFTPVAVYLVWGGLGLTGAALAMGVLAMLFNPAYPRPITVRWPEGVEGQANPHIPAVDPHEADGHQVEPDDLTRIEGIGPKVQKVLNQAGIMTFAEVASRTPDQLKEVLEAARFRGPIHPGTWPQQAGLAAKGDWDSLKNLQKQLSAGRSAR